MSRNIATPVWPPESKWGVHKLQNKVLLTTASPGSWKIEVPMSDNINAIVEMVQDVRGKMRATKVTASHSLKTSRGDFFASFTSSFVPQGEDETGLSRAEGRVAAILVSMEASLAVWRAARSENAVSAKEHREHEEALRHNTRIHLKRITNEQ